MSNSDEQSLEKFIAYLANKIAVLYPSNCADEEDYIQAGHLKLAEINNNGCNKRDFRAYAIVAIARAMREAALEAIGATSAPERIKRLIHRIELFIVSGKTEKEICQELQIDTKTLSDMKSLISTESWHRLFDEPTYNSEPFSVISDLLSSRCLTDEDRSFLQSQLEDDSDTPGMTRKQRWSQAIGLRPKLERSGYGFRA